jgi:hypothetical protein
VGFAPHFIDWTLQSRERSFKGDTSKLSLLMPLDFISALRSLIVVILSGHTFFQNGTGTEPDRNINTSECLKDLSLNSDALF